jgi:hypothetical protein
VSPGHAPGTARNSDDVVRALGISRSSSRSHMYRYIDDIGHGQIAQDVHVFAAAIRTQIDLCESTRA